LILVGVLRFFWLFEVLSTAAASRRMGHQTRRSGAAAVGQPELPCGFMGTFSASSASLLTEDPSFGMVDGYRGRPFPVFGHVGMS